MMKIVSSFLSLAVGVWNGKLGTTEPGLAQLCASPTSSTLANLCTALPADLLKLSPFLSFIVVQVIWRQSPSLSVTVDKCTCKDI